MVLAIFYKILQLMIYFFAENIDFSMYVLLRMNAHFNPARYNIFYKLIHPILYFFIILSFLDILFYFIKKLLLRLLSVRIKKQTLLISLISQLIYIDANQYTNVGSLLYKLPYMSSPVWPDFVFYMENVHLCGLLVKSAREKVKSATNFW